MKTMTENMKAFLTEAAKDEEFKTKVEAARTKEAVTELAKEKGFTLSNEDLKPFIQPVKEISDDDLENVSGGGYAEDNDCTLTVLVYCYQCVACDKSYLDMMTTCPNCQCMHTIAHWDDYDRVKAEYEKSHNPIIPNVPWTSNRKGPR